MRIARVSHADGVDHAVLEGETAELIADPFAGLLTSAQGPVLRRLGRRIALEEVRLLAPVEPRTVVGMAHNTGPEDRRLPPQAFLKPARSVIGPHDPIPLPDGIGRVDAEAELAVVLGASLEGHTEETVHRAVFGCTVGNDVTARELQSRDSLWTTAKGRYGFTPLGPWIETDLDAADVRVALSIDGEPLRAASTAALARGVAEILCHLAEYLPLGPGDVVLTGAPGESGAIRQGGTTQATVDGIGTLTNPVARIRRPSRTTHPSRPYHRSTRTPCPPAL